MTGQCKTGARRLSVLVVDDSAVVRQAMTVLLGQEADLHVTAAPTAAIALQKVARERPDVIVLDIEMPEMDGLAFLQRIMAENPVPVVICSGYAERGTERALRALELGAVDIVNKPQMGVREFLEESSVLIADTVRAAAQVRVRPREGSPAAGEPKLTADAVIPFIRRRPLACSPTEMIVAVGASTGGTEAIQYLLQAMSVDAPGMILVQHMPGGFTRAFADRLDTICRIEVKEAASGDEVLRGRALIAPGDRHLLVKRRGIRYFTEVAEGPLVSRHRPSVDVLFRSVADAAGPNAVGVLLTGMGDDGAKGLLEMKQAGAMTLAQDEASSVVFGMPKEAIRLGAADRAVSLYRLPTLVAELTRNRATLM